MANRPVTVLIVDDDQAVRQLLRRALVHLFEPTVLEAPDGLTALERLASDSVDVVILDVDMPVMNGVETVEAIRQSPAHAELPVVMLTSVTDETKVNRLMEMKVADFIVKPFSLDGIRTRLGPILATASGARRSVQPTPPWQFGAASHLLVVDGDDDFLRSFADRFKAVCRVEGVQTAIGALRHCVSDPPDAMLLGSAASSLLNDTMLVRKLRETQELSAVRLFRMVAAEDVDLAIASGLYDDVLARPIDCESTLAGLGRYLDAGSVARLLLAPASPSVHTMAVTANDMLAEMLGAEVQRQPAQGMVMPSDNRWVTVGLDVNHERQRWRLTMVWTHPLALQATGSRLGLPSDLISETQVGMVVSDVIGRIAEFLRRALGDRGLECSIGPAAVRLVNAQLAKVDILARACGTIWMSTPHGAGGVLLRLSPE